MQTEKIYQAIKSTFTVYYPDQFNVVTAEVVRGNRRHAIITVQDVKDSLAKKLGIPVTAFELSQNGKILPLNIAASTYFQEESFNMNFAHLRPKVIITLTNIAYTLPPFNPIVHPVIVHPIGLIPPQNVDFSTKISVSLKASTKNFVVPSNMTLE